MDYHTEIERKYNESYKQYQDLKRKKDEFDTLSIEIQIATILHETLCKKNHSVGECDWYEKNINENAFNIQSDRLRFLSYTKELIAIGIDSKEKLKKILNIFRNI